MNGQPRCYWCAELVELHELKMGEVKVKKRGHTRTQATFDIFDSHDEDWEEEWEERRPFHRYCWEVYKRYR